MTLFSQVRFPIASWLWLSLGAAIALPGIAMAQTDYSAGKTPQQLFAGDCSACHQSPQGLARGRDASTLTGFLRDHYTTKVEWAGVLANYLVGVGGTRPRPPQQPAPGASTTRAPQPPAAIPGGTEEAIAAPSNEAKPPAATGARDRPKLGDSRSAKGKLTPVESERDTAKANADSLQSKLRNYATVGEEAKSAGPDGPAAPTLRPSADAVRSGEPGSASPAGGGAPVPPTGRAPATGTPANERPTGGPPG
jgi:mono/diheme cytochrome c family protein